MRADCRHDYLPTSLIRTPPPSRLKSIFIKVGNYLILTEFLSFLIFFPILSLKLSVPHFFKNYFNAIPSYINSYYTRGSTNLFINKISSEVAKRVFCCKCAIIFY